MKYIVERAVTSGVSQWVKTTALGMGWTYLRMLAQEFETREQAESAISELHGGTVVEVDA